MNKSEAVTSSCTVGVSLSAKIMIISSNSFSEQCDIIVIYKKTSCLKECNIVKMVQDILDYGDMQFYNWICAQNAGSSKSCTTEPQFYIVLIYVKLNITKCELLMLMDLALRSLSYRLASFAYSEKNILFQMLFITSGGFNYKLYPPDSDTIFTFLREIHWIHLAMSDLITTWKGSHIDDTFYKKTQFDRISYTYYTAHWPIFARQHPTNQQ